MKFVIAIVVSTILFAVVPVSTHWWWDIVCAIEISVIVFLIASNFINIGAKHSLPPENKGKHLIQGNS